MKKCSALIGVLILAFSLSFLCWASGAKAETAQGDSKSLVSILKLKATSMMGQTSASSGETVHERRPLREISVSLNHELDAFLDFKSPHPQGFRTKNSRSDMRAVLGFHLTLR